MAAVPTSNLEPSGSPIVRIVARNTAFMLGGQIVLKILAFAFSVFVVRQLGDAHFGRYAAALAYVAIFAMLTDLGTSSLSVREMARKKENIAWMVPDIMALRAVLSVAAIVLITLSAWLLGRPLDIVTGIFIASLGLLFYAFQGPLDSVIIARERLDFSSVFNLLNKIIFMALGMLLLLLGMGYIGLLIATLVGILVMGVASHHVIRRVLKLHFERPDPRRWWPLLRASFPFGITGATREFARRFDTVFMSFVLTDAAVGWYNVPYNMLITMMVMAQSMAMSIYPTMVREYNSGHGAIQGTVQRALRYLLILSLPIAIGGTLLADQLIILLYGQQFAPSIDVMRILVWVLPFMFFAEMLGRTSNTMHLESKMMRVSIIVAVIGITLNIILIPRLGIIGAAIAVVTTRLVDNILSSMLIGPAMLYKGNVLPLLRVVAAAGVMGAVVWILRTTLFASSLSHPMALLALICIGAVSYGFATLLLGAISRSESRYVANVIKRKLRGLRRKGNVACAS